MKTKLEQKKDEIAHLDLATQSIINSIQNKDKWFRRFAYFTLSLLILVGVIGIYKQNVIAAQNQKHIDCIVKLFTKPLPPQAHSRQIVNASTTCNIKFN